MTRELPDQASPLPRYDWEEAVSATNRDFAATIGLSVPVSDLLLSRGLLQADDPEGAVRFLDAPIGTMLPPMTMAGVAEASRKIIRAIEGHGPIVVFGDYDCDGVVATAILTDVLRSLGGDVRPFIPTRAEGYGLSEEAVTRCLEATPAPALLVTVDCGMGAGESLRRFLDLGCEVVVSDHHTPSTPLPAACTVVSTFNEGVPECCRTICGAGVAYKIACGVVTTLYPAPDRTGRGRLYRWLDALAMATVADVVPLLGENRIYIRAGLDILNNHRPTSHVGLSALIEATFKRAQDVTPEHLGFILAPHINSAGRMDSADSALELLLAEDKDRARKLALELKECNAKRRREEQKVLEEARGKLEPGYQTATDGGEAVVFSPEKDGAIVVEGEGWHPGTIGIAAARLCDTYRRPVVVISLDGDEGRGSVRAPEGYHAYRALQACADHLRHFGGHANAAGLSIGKGQIEAFRRAFADECRAQVGATCLRPKLSISGWLGFGDIDGRLLRSIERMGPCGMGNPDPCWALAGVETKVSRMGQDNRHLRLLISREDGVRLAGVWFGAGEYAPLFEKHPRWDIAGVLQENDYRGDREIQLVVSDARPTPSPDGTGGASSDGTAPDRR